MRKLAWDTSFRRAFKRRTQSDAPLRNRIFQVLGRLAEDPFHPALKTHKLSGQLGESCANGPSPGGRGARTVEARLLVVEPNRKTLERLAQWLSYLRYEVYAATDSASALRTARRERPDMVLIAVPLPDSGEIRLVRE